MFANALSSLTMNLDPSKQASLLVIFFGTFSVGIIPPALRRLWAQRRDNNVFNVSESNVKKTCIRHQKHCISTESLVLQVANFFTGGILFAFLVMRLIPRGYRQFDHVIGLFNKSSHEDNDSSHYHQKFPYVELTISGFFFIVYFLEQLLQVSVN